MNLDHPFFLLIEEDKRVDSDVEEKSDLDVDLDEIDRDLNLDQPYYQTKSVRPDLFDDSKRTNGCPFKAYVRDYLKKSKN